jgi:hypothetical protein
MMCISASRWIVMYFHACRRAGHQIGRPKFWALLGPANETVETYLPGIEPHLAIWTVQMARIWQPETSPPQERTYSGWKKRNAVIHSWTFPTHASSIPSLPSVGGWRFGVKKFCRRGPCTHARTCSIRAIDGIQPTISWSMLSSTTNRAVIINANCMHTAMGSVLSITPSVSKYKMF